MSELLAASVTLNLFVIWRFVNLHRIHHRVMRLLFEVAHGRAVIHADEDGVSIKAIKTKT
jgi:hypothetical protein